MYTTLISEEEIEQAAREMDKLSGDRLYFKPVITRSQEELVHFSMRYVNVDGIEGYSRDSRSQAMFWVKYELTSDDTPADTGRQMEWRASETTPVALNHYVKCGPILSVGAYCGKCEKYATD